MVMLSLVSVRFACVGHWSNRVLLLSFILFCICLWLVKFPVNPLGPVVRPPSAYIMKHPVTDSHIYTHHQMVIDEFPERPGQPDCSYFLKTGDCKFRSNCKYHHPKDRISKSPPVVLSDKGLPLRPVMVSHFFFVVLYLCYCSLVEKMKTTHFICTLEALHSASICLLDGGSF